MDRGFSKQKVKRIIEKSLAALLAAAVFALGYTPEMAAVREAPDAVFGASYEELSEKTGGSQKGVLAVQSSLDETLGECTLSYKLFGLIPVRTVPVFVGKRAELVPGGDPVGVSIRTDGVLVVGVGKVSDGLGKYYAPAEQAGLRPGDVILSVNGEPISDSSELESAVSNGGPAELSVERGGRRLEITVTPVCGEDGKPKLGAWVRDSTVGIGTLSFYDRDTGVLAALGHAVVDMDTGSLLKVRDGRLVIASVLGVTRGAQGSPGELHGTFGKESPVLGRIILNTELGIFGEVDPSCSEFLERNEIPVAFPDEVRTGEAVILCSADGTIREYSCRIVKASRQGEPAPKGLVIEITDSELTELTGGIVQGMSGSPVIQNGMLVGAVTHVFVNDPKRGYGAYAYWMYKSSGGY
jgi:stage IV sporulation protein B